MMRWEIGHSLGKSSGALQREGALLALVATDCQITSDRQQSRQKPSKSNRLAVCYGCWRLAAVSWMPRGHGGARIQA